MKHLRTLLLAQFLSAFADNAILFTAIAMVLREGQTGGWYVPAMQSAFLVAFVLLAPWVGSLADRRSKPGVLILGNLFKLAGAGLTLAGVEPLLAYALVGVGGAVYGPAKYGILPELVDPRELVKANGWMEGATIVAIVLGTVVGAQVADHSIDAALWLVVAAFVLSILLNLRLPRLPARAVAPAPALRGFTGQVGRLFRSARARFSLLGTSLFWAAAAVLRVIIVAWAPLGLGLASSAAIAGLTLWLALGIVLGAGLAPRLIPRESLGQARLPAYAMGALIVALAGVSEPQWARVVLFAAGVAGGLFVVPINAALQELGHHSIGAGGAVAIQNFFENLGMLLAVGLYTWSSGAGGQPLPSLLVLGTAVVTATAVVSWRLPAVVAGRS